MQIETPTVQHVPEPHLPATPVTIPQTLHSCKTTHAWTLAAAGTSFKVLNVSNATLAVLPAPATLTTTVYLVLVASTLKTGTVCLPVPKILKLWTDHVRATVRTVSATRPVLHALRT